MSGEFEQLERQVEAQMCVLRGLREVRPSAACLAQVHAAVAAEAARSQGALRRWRAARGVVGAAAAVLLALGWGVTRGAAGAGAGDGEILNDWVNAADASGRAVTMLTDPFWTPADDAALSGEGVDAEADLDDLFRSFEDLQEIGA